MPVGSVSSGDFTNLIANIRRDRLPGETESRALLYWFFFNVYRLDAVAARDSVCDKKNDKGIDGVWVDDDTNEIFLFQAKFTEDEANSLGDSDLREFVGSATWFSHPDNVKKLLAASTNAELKALVSRLHLLKNLEEDYEVKLVFVTTRKLDTSGREYLETLERADQHLDLWDQERLIGQHKYLARKTRVPGKHRFSLPNGGVPYSGAQGRAVFFGPIRAADVASMNGIADRTLFSLNVRLGLGRTRVNKDLEMAIRESSRHDQFLLFHNGLTIICGRLTAAADHVEVEDYSVVNGCQSAIAFYDNRSLLSDQLLVLARFIEVGSNDVLAEDITYRSNNQNGINLRDLKSNDRIQLTLKRQFERDFPGKIGYVIKEGETVSGKPLSNERAGQFLMALYLREPYNAHQKYRIFGSDYERVFGREINAIKIYLASLLYEAVESAVSHIDDVAIRDYQLTRFVLLGLLGEILRRDRLGAQLLDAPEKFVPANNDRIMGAIRRVAEHLAVDFNYYITERQRVAREAEDYYDYKSEFKSPAQYATIASDMLREYDRAVVRHPEDRFESLIGAPENGKLPSS